ncbi:hypothetical protein PHYBOEH_000174 [Phytophthora boehmeriae]|uniref:Uncharacterized protein n=1 Tax=Phytophthora boehmeriae TaxID=109152 RepID=A0A8T1X196_9STRA|nr:hypothetical protein PHYBOEH_000174 [Phytophthora boehmeriae]
MAHWWRRDELLALLQAWEQTLPAPRDRDDLTPQELAVLYDRFGALRPSNGAPIPPSEVETQRQRLVRTFLFLRAFNAESDRAGRPTWFQLPPPQQEDLRRINGRLGDLAAVDQDEFKELERICDQPAVATQQEAAAEEDAPQELRPPVAVDEMKAAAEALAGLPMFVARPTLSPSLSPPSSPIRTTKKTVAPIGLTVANDNSDSESVSGNGFSDGESEIGDGKRRKDSDVDYVPLKGKGKGKNASKWPKRDEKCLVDAWHEVTQRFESLLTEFREERRQERQHNVEIIVEALKLRSATAQKADQTSPFVEGLVEKQRQHMLDLFNQLQEERSQEREQARMLLRELSHSGLVSNQDTEAKE